MKSRNLTVLAALLLVLLILSFMSLTRGTLPVSSDQLWQVLKGDAPRGITMVVVDWRLPRVVAALITGAALALSGAIFQSLLRNPLGSPDVLGFNTGAFSAVLLAMVFLPGQPAILALAALAGGLVTAALVYLFSWRHGVATFRLIIVGIGIRALLMSLNSWLITTASLDTALSAGLWSAGSLNGISWNSLPPVALILLLATVATALLAKCMRLLEMGDDMAAALGIPVERSRMLLMLVGVVLTAVSTALIGPVSFVALVAPQIASRLCRHGRYQLIVSAFSGAALLLAADYIATHVFVPYQLPVGVVTVSLGGLYLMSLLVREARRK